jgi:hypothetical protein
MPSLLIDLMQSQENSLLFLEEFLPYHFVSRLTIMQTLPLLLQCHSCLNFPRFFKNELNAAGKTAKNGTTG